MYQQTGTDPEALIASREKVTAINEIITAIIGAYQSASEIKLYTMDGSCVEAGYWMRTSNIHLESLEWLFRLSDDENSALVHVQFPKLD